MKHALAGAICLGLLLLGVPGFAAETLTLYDDFNAYSYLHPYKWGASTSDLMDSSLSLYSVSATDRVVRLAGRGWGFRTTNADLSEGRGANSRLRFRRLDPNVIRAVQATVRVVSATAVGCPSSAGSPEVTQARFRIGGYFFNDGTGEPGRSLGDVFARVEVRRLANNPTPNELDVRANVQRCTDTECVHVDTLFNLVLGTIAVGTEHTLLLQWDNAANQFIFQLDANAPARYTYTVRDTMPPQNFWDKKYVGLNHWVPDCAAGATSAYMAVDLDDVFLNTAATASAYSPIIGIDYDD
jgi:hypothetical protein